MRMERGISQPTLLALQYPLPTPLATPRYASWLVPFTGVTPPPPTLAELSVEWLLLQNFKSDLANTDGGRLLDFAQ